MEVSMRAVAAGVLAGLFSAGLVARAALPARSDAQEPAREQQCGMASAPQLRTTLYFGLARPVHPDTLAAREAVQTVIARYRRAFEQDSVLWETARVCAAT